MTGIPNREVDVLVIGEALLDVVHVGASTSAHPGGSPANVALGLGRRGLQVAFLTDIGRDAAADRILRHLELSAVRVLEESISDRPTSQATATIAADGSATYRFDVDWQPSTAPVGLSARVVHTGSIAAFLALGSTAVLEHLRRSPGRFTTFDPNIRPALLGSHSEALETFETFASRSDVVKMSDEDAAWLYPHLDPESAARAVLGLGPKLAVTTLGAAGAILSTALHRVVVPAVPTPVADTIGAGDTYMSSLIADLVSTFPQHFDERTLTEIGRRAAAAAAITVSRPGADLPWRAELAALS